MDYIDQLSNSGNDYLKIVTRFHTQEELDWWKEKYWLTDEDLK